MDRLLPLQMDAGALSWVSREDPGARCRVLIIAANQAANPGYDLPAALPSALAIQKAFQHIGIRPEDILVRQGAEVAVLRPPGGGASKLEQHIKEAIKDLEGNRDSLLVIWIGHGRHFDGDLQLLTSDSASLGGHLTATLGARDLAYQVQAASEAIPGLHTGLIVDVCRTSDQAFEMPTVDDNWETAFKQREILTDVEAYSTAPGREAFVDTTTNQTRYASALVQVLDRSAKDLGVRKIGLMEVLNKVRERAELGTQEPPPPAGHGDLVLHDPSNLSLEIQVTDSRSGEPIPNAVIEFQGNEKPAPATFEGLGASAQGYDVLVTAPGYFYRRELVQLDRARSGDALSIPLAPAFVGLEGSIGLTEGSGAVIVVKATGEFPGLIDGYHASSFGPSEAGPFRLKLPFTPGQRHLRVEVNGVLRLEVPFDLATMSPDPVKVEGGSINTYDFGVRVLPPARRVADWGAVTTASIGPVSFEFDFGRLSQEDFTDQRGWTYYEEIQRAADPKYRNYSRAEQQLELLQSRNRVKEAGREAIGELAYNLSVAATIDRANALFKSGDLEPAIEVLRTSEQAADERLEPVLHSWLLQSARDLRNAKHFAASLERLQQAIECDPRSRARLEALASQARTDWMEDAFNVGLESGDWSEARTVVRVLAESGDVARGDEWSERVEREAISVPCRRNYNQALEARKDGKPEEAERLFYAALAQRPNAHYEARIREHMRSLKDELFDKHYRIAYELEAKGDLVGALQAHLRACVYDPELVEIVIRDLLETNAELLAKEAPADKRLAEAFLSQRGVVNRYYASLEEFDFASADKVLESLSGQGMGMFELEDLRHGYDLAREDYTEQVFRNFAQYATLGEGELRALLERFERLHPRLASELSFAGLATFGVAPRKLPVASYVHRKSGVEFVLVPGGLLRMGQVGSASDQTPVHEVALQPFLIARHECSAATWYRGLSADRGAAAAGSGEDPAGNIPHDQAERWCESMGLSLPTEAQWEWAALAGKSEDQSVPTLANAATSVTFGPQNALGLQNMLGNMYEWCLEPYLPYQDEVRGPRGQRVGRPAESGTFVIRGGSFQSPSFSAKRRARNHAPSHADLGFRPVFNFIEDPE